MPVDHELSPPVAHRTLDGRQAAGRKGVPYDWQAVAPAELGQGPYERQLTAGAHLHVGAGIREMVVRHGGAFTLSDRLTVRDGDGVPVDRPTVPYAYRPADAHAAAHDER